VENTSQLGSEQVSLLTREFGVSLNFGTQVSSKDVLDLHRGSDVLRLALGKLNPVVKEVIRDPVNELVETSATLLNFGSEDFSLISKASTDHPVVSLSSINFSEESDLVSATHDAETLDGVLELVSVFFSETNVSPLEHLSLLSEVGKANLFRLNFLLGAKADTIHQVFTFLDVLGLS
jgi:hypothetical protein